MPSKTPMPCTFVNDVITDGKLIQRMNGILRIVFFALLFLLQGFNVGDERKFYIRNLEARINGARGYGYGAFLEFHRIARGEHGVNSIIQKIVCKRLSRPRCACHNADGVAVFQQGQHVILKLGNRAVPGIKALNTESG